MKNIEGYRGKESYKNEYTFNNLKGNNVKSFFRSKRSVIGLLLIGLVFGLLIIFVFESNETKAETDPETFECLETLTEHSEGLRTVAFSPNNEWLASGSKDDSIKIWNTSNWVCIKTLTGHSNSVLSVEFSSNNEWLASGSEDNTIKIWDTSNWSCITTLTGHYDNIGQVAFSPNIQYLASGSSDYTIKIWDTSNWSCIKTLTEHSSYVESVAFSPNNEWLASGAYGEIKIWDTSNWSCIKTLGHPNYVCSVPFSSNNEWLASGSHDSQIRIWNTSDWSCIKTLTGHSNCLWGTAFSLNSKWLASGSWDNTIKIWDTSNWSCIKTLTEHSDRVYSVAFSPNNQLLASGSYDNTIKIWGNKYDSSYITSLKIGWNIIGLPNNQSMQLNDIVVMYNNSFLNWHNATSNNNTLCNPIILRFVYGWNRTSQQYELVNELEPGYGYWMYAYYNCTLLKQTNTTASQTITKNQILPIDFTWKPKSNYAGNPVQFKTTITIPPIINENSQLSKYNIVSWYWDFNSLGTSTEQNPSFTFDGPGIYPVTLSVWNEERTSDSITYNIIIYGNEIKQSFIYIKYAQAGKYSDSTINNQQIAQSFIATTSNLESISLYLSSIYNTPKTAIIEIKTNAKDQWNRDIPSNNVIASTEISFSEISSCPTWINFNVGANLIHDKKYWVVLKDDDLESSSNYILWWQKYEWTGNGETYLDGEKAYTQNNNENWYPNKLGDRFFKIEDIYFTEENIFKMIDNTKSNETINSSSKIIENDSTNLDTEKDIIEDINLFQNEKVNNNKPNNNMLKNENEENSLNKEINEDNCYDSIFLIKASIVILTILICAFAICKKYKK